MVPLPRCPSGKFFLKSDHTVLPAFSLFQRSSSLLHLLALGTLMPTLSAGHWPWSWAPAHHFSQLVLGPCPMAQGGLLLLAWGHLEPQGHFLWALHLAPKVLSEEESGSQGTGFSSVPSAAMEKALGPSRETRFWDLVSSSRK